MVERLRKTNDITYEEELSDSAKSQAMQLILDNSDQFEQEVVDEALIKLNSEMHIPILDESEIETLGGKNNKDEVKEEEASIAENNLNVTDEILNMINDDTNSKDEDLV